MLYSPLLRANKITIEFSKPFRSFKIFGNHTWIKWTNFKEEKVTNFHRSPLNRTIYGFLHVYRWWPTDEIIKIVLFLWRADELNSQLTFSVCLFVFHQISSTECLWCSPFLNGFVCFLHHSNLNCPEIRCSRCLERENFSKNSLERSVNRSKCNKIYLNHGCRHHDPFDAESEWYANFRTNTISMERNET